MILLMVATIVLDGVPWLAGYRQYRLAEAVEEGAAHVEQRMLGEDSPDVVREQIELQRDSLRFWTVVALLEDFLLVPLTLVFRALLASTAFSAIAAVSGRRSRFPIIMSDAVRWQAVWVIGIAVHVVLMLVLDRDSVDTAVTVLLPAGPYSASTWTNLQQLDFFALVGWLGIAWSGWRHQQANIVVAPLICLVLAAIEVSIFASGNLLINLSMRLTLIPQ